MATMVCWWIFSRRLISLRAWLSCSGIQAVPLLSVQLHEQQSSRTMALPIVCPASCR